MGGLAFLALVSTLFAQPLEVALARDRAYVKVELSARSEGKVRWRTTVPTSTTTVEQSLLRGEELRVAWRRADGTSGTLSFVAPREAPAWRASLSLPSRGPPRLTVYAQDELPPGAAVSVVSQDDSTGLAEFEIDNQSDAYLWVEGAETEGARWQQNCGSMFLVPPRARRRIHSNALLCPTGLPAGQFARVLNLRTLGSELHREVRLRFPFVNTSEGAPQIVFPESPVEQLSVVEGFDDAVLLTSGDEHRCACTSIVVARERLRLERAGAQHCAQPADGGVCEWLNFSLSNMDVGDFPPHLPAR